MHYNNIYFNTTLPPVLSKEEMLDLFLELKEGSISAREKLILHNIKFVIYIIKNNFDMIIYNMNYDFNDFISIGIIGLIKAIDTYKLENGTSFLGYAKICIINEINLFLQKLQKHYAVDSLDRQINDEDQHAITIMDEIVGPVNIQTNFEDKEEYEIIRKLINELPELEKRIIKLYFGFGCKPHVQNDIAKLTGVTQIQISRTLAKAYRLLGIKMAEYYEYPVDMLKAKHTNLIKLLKRLIYDMAQASKSHQSIEDELFLIVEDTIQELSDREKQVLRLYFGFEEELPHTQEEVSHILSTSDSTVSGIFKKSLNYILSKIKKAGKIELLENYQSKSNYSHLKLSKNRTNKPISS